MYSSLAYTSVSCKHRTPIITLLCRPTAPHNLRLRTSSIFIASSARAQSSLAVRFVAFLPSNTLQYSASSAVQCHHSPSSSTDYNAYSSDIPLPNSIFHVFLFFQERARYEYENMRAFKLLHCLNE